MEARSDCNARCISEVENFMGIKSGLVPVCTIKLSDRPRRLYKNYSARCNRARIEIRAPTYSRRFPIFFYLVVVKPIRLR